ncbi:hypothetical protein ACEWY4_003178 [Coilia grayii]|uniref:Ig-like domain-containing protein n=1 Tax=Coilia grayii TaxID=363190 RepID=A0ABD1KQI6_9TELE
MLPSEEEGLQNKTSTFVCLARDFAPQLHKFHWEYNGNHLLGESSCEQKGSEANFTASSYLVISHADWASGASVKCMFEHRTGNLSKQVQQGGDLTPSVILHPPMWRGKDGGSKAQLLCAFDGVDMKSLAVEWSVDGNPQPNSEMFGQSSRLEVDTRDWNPGSRYSCKVKPGDKKSWIEKSIQVCSDGHFLAPEAELDRPPLRDVITQEEVVVMCRVTAAGASRVSWRVDDKNTQSQAVKEYREADGRLISNLTLPVTTWKALRSVSCKVEHPCYPTEASITMPEPGSKEPTVIIRRPLEDWERDQGSVLECLLGGLSSTEVSVTLQANGKDLPKTEYVTIPVQKDQNSLTAVRFTIPDDQKGVNKRFSCKVNHNIQAKSPKISSSTGKLFAPPTLELFHTPGSGSTNLVCVGSGFNPQLKWNLSELKLNAIKKKSMGEGGRLTVTSEVDVPQTEWYKGTTFSCEVKDENQKHQTRNISICSAAPHTGFADVHLVGPPVNVTASDDVLVTCLLVGYGISELPIVWKVDGRVVSDGVTTPPSSVNANGTQSRRSELKLEAKKWHGRADVSCEVARLCDTAPLVRSISKPKGQLSVELAPPSQRDIFLYSKVALECIITGADSAAVDDAQVTWTVAGDKQPSQSPDKQGMGNGQFRKVSKLMVNMADWFSGKVIECLVSDQHDGVVKDSPLTRSIQKSDGADPEVLIYTLPEARDPNHDSVVCEVRGPSLGDVYVMWQVDGGGYVEGNTGLLHQDNGNVSVVSILTVKSQRVADATLFTCAVKHGGMKDYTAPLSVQYSKMTRSVPTVTLLHRPGELVCLVFGFSPVAINITWLKNSIRVEAPEQGTAQPSRGPDGRFSTHSHLNLTSGDWDSGMKFTCVVTHVTGELSQDISKPEPKNEVFFHDDNMADAVPEDTVAETLNMAWAFLFLFLLSLLYSCTATLIKVRHTAHMLRAHSLRSDTQGGPLWLNG